MRLRYVMELVFAFGVGLALARYRLSWPDWAETFGPMTRIAALEAGIDCLLAGIGFVEGLATLVERARGRSPAVWGLGRRVWFFVATYLLLTQLDQVLGSIAVRFTAVYIQNSLATEVVQGFRGEYGMFLLPGMTWILLALVATSLADRRPSPTPTDAREWAGRVFTAVLLLTGIGLRAALLLGFRHSGMGGGMG